MKKFVLLIVAAAMLSGCTTWWSAEDGSARKAAKLLLTTYQTAQEGAILYGQLPSCDPVAGITQFCKDQEIWVRIKSADKVAVTAILDAYSVVNGLKADSGEMTKAMLAVDSFRQVLLDAQNKTAGRRKKVEL